MTRRTALVTGATGFVGSNLTLALLLEGTTVYGVVRPSGGPSSRLEQAVIAAAEAAGLASRLPECLGRLVAVPGDLMWAGLGLTSEDRARLQDARLDELWHCAATLRFEPQFRDEIRANNVGGTERVLELARSLGVKAFNHVSTAYVAGARRGHIPEDRYDPIFAPSNYYEESKRHGEDRVLAARDAGAFEVVRIFRPSIVIGHSATFESLADTGPNGFMVAVDRFKTEMDDKVPGYLATHPLRVLGERRGGMDGIPVDHVVREALAIARGGEEGTFFHLTNPFTVPLESTLAALNRVLPGLKVELVEDPAALRPADLLFQSRLQFYASYMKADKVFERRRDRGKPPEELRVTDEDVVRYAERFLVRMRRDQERKTLKAKQALAGFQRRTLRCRYGEPLTYFTQGEGPALVLINAYGVSLEFWKKVLPGLLPGRKLITWECRGCMQGSPERRFLIGDHVADLEEILQHEGVVEAHLVGWCTGAKVAVEFAGRHPNKVLSLTSVTGAFGPLRGAEHLKTRYDQTIGTMAAMVCRRPEMAGVMLRAATGAFGLTAAGSEETDALVADLMGMVSPKMRHMISGPFMSEQVIERYAHMLADFLAHDVSGLLPSLRVPSLIIGAENDAMVHPGLAAEAAARLPQGRHITLRGATHWCLLENAEEVVREMSNFLNQVDGQSEPWPQPVVVF